MTTATAAIAEFHPNTAKPFNFWQTIGIPSRGTQLFEALHSGLPYEVFSKLAEFGLLDKKALAQATVISPATLQRRAKNGQFNKDESDRLYRFSLLLKAAIDLFEGDNVAGAQWLKQPIRGLGDKTPLSMLGTSAESQTVLDMIGRLEHGVYC